MASKYFICFICVVFVSMVVGNPREILVDDEIPVFKTNNIQNLGNEENQNEENSICHMEYQVMRRVIGRCMKLGRTTKGCVAGNYLHPFHPECL